MKHFGSGMLLQMGPLLVIMPPTLHADLLSAAVPAPYAADDAV
jgi:hypothetical protein